MPPDKSTKAETDSEPPGEKRKPETQIGRRISKTKSNAKKEGERSGRDVLTQRRHNLITAFTPMVWRLDFTRFGSVAGGRRELLSPNDAQGQQQLLTYGVGVGDSVHGLLGEERLIVLLFSGWPGGRGQSPHMRQDKRNTGETERVED